MDEQKRYNLRIRKPMTTNTNSEVMSRSNKGEKKTPKSQNRKQSVANGKTVAKKIPAKRRASVPFQQQFR